MSNEHVPELLQSKLNYIINRLNKDSEIKDLFISKTDHRRIDKINYTGHISKNYIEVVLKDDKLTKIIISDANELITFLKDIVIVSYQNWYRSFT